MKKVTIIVIILAILTGLVGFYYYQKNIYSKEVLKLEILGPETTDLLQEVEHVVKYKNNGNFRLENPELSLEPPKYALSNGKFLERKIPEFKRYVRDESRINLIPHIDFKIDYGERSRQRLDQLS